MVLWNSRLILLLLYGASVCFSAAIPVISLEQVTGGNRACTSARRQVLSALRATSRELTRISAISARNQTIRTSARQALTGMRDATTGISQVAFSLLAGDEPTQASRDRVERGFGSVKNALETMTGVQNANIARRVTRAKSSLDKAIAARDKLVVECQTSSASTSTTATAGTVETILPESASSEAVSSTSSSETTATSVTLTRTTIILTAETSPPLPAVTVASTIEAEGNPAPTETVEELPLPSVSILTLTGSAATAISSTEVISPTPITVVSDTAETLTAIAAQF